MNRSLAPSNTTYEPSLKTIWGYPVRVFLTNMPQTGHLSFAEGVTGARSPANPFAARRPRNNNAMTQLFHLPGMLPGFCCSIDFFFIIALRSRIIFVS